MASPEPGWYPDPELEGHLRFWNGTAWTDGRLSAEGTSDCKHAEKLAKRIEVSMAQQQAAAQLDASHDSYTQRVNNLITQATEYAAAGDIEREERTMRSIINSAKEYGGKNGVQSVTEFLDSLIAKGKLRIGSSLIGTISPENGLFQYARTESLSRVTTGGKSATVYSDRVFHGDTVYVIDESTGAQVTLDGQIQITQRPTLTRMAILSPLPGTALIPGLALQKKRQNDSRTAFFIMASSKWSFTIPIDPNNVNKPREIAERINSIAGAMERKEENSPIPRVTQVSQTSRVSELSELKQLLDSGLINEAEAEKLKQEILNR